MAAYLAPTDALWTIQAKERARYEEQFKSLNPENGVVTGEQAKGFFLQSQLPPNILGQIWALSDTDSDGRMDINEFSIACKLINLKLRGFQIPSSLPPALKNISAQFPAINSLDTSIMKNSILPQVIPQLPAQPLPVQSGLVNQPYVGVQPTIAPLMNVDIPGVSAIPRTSVSGSPQLTPTIGMPIKTSNAGIIHNMPINQPLNFSVGNQNIPAPVIPPILPQTTEITSQIPCVIPQVQAITTSSIPGMPLPGTITTVPPISSNLLQDSSKECPKPMERGQSIDSLASALGSPVGDWAVPHQSKLKYTQLFNTTDRTRTGFLSGPQAKNILIQTKLPQAVLAQIWALADCDSDGRINCEEFVLAMHLCDMAKEGRSIPSTLPIELIPPAMRRKRNSSFSVSDDRQEAALISNVTFEDKRKENFDKGQAELERRRAILLEAQRKEQEEREKKEREEQEKREAIRLEQEARRQEELQKQLQKQRENELEQEEQRKRALEQREAARKELEKQRQQEWEKARTLELEAQRMKEQDNVLKLKGKNQALAIELATLTGKVKELSQKISETRAGVSAVKTTIDGMRTTRDKHMTEMASLKSKLKEQNQRLLLLTQEKARLEARNKVGAVANAAASEQIMLAFTNKQIIIKHLNEKIADLQNEVKIKTEDVENNGKVLNDLKSNLEKLVNDCETLYTTYSDKRDSILQLKNATGGSSAWGSTQNWKNTTDSWNSSDVSNWNTATVDTTGVRKYRAIYKFESRNVDELSFEPGDIITVRSSENAEPGWLAGELRGASGWFPEAYVEIIDPISNLPSSGEILGDQEKLPLEGISELPEPVSENIAGENLQEQYISIYRYESAESGDLCFEQGETITVIKKDGDWWTGVIGDRTGLFPSNYVEKVSSEIINSAPVLQTEEAPSMADDDSVFIQPTTEESKSEVSKSPLPISVSGRETPADLEQNKPVTPDFSSITSAQTKITKKGEVATVIAPYQATSSEQLSLSRGQLVCIRKKTTTGWWEGELQAKGKKKQVGWFPASYVKVMSSRRLSQTTPDIEAEQNFEKVVAMFPYKAQNEDELSFEQDDVIKVLVKEEPTWWRGELKGTTGLFPSNYVMPLDNQLPLKVNVDEKLRQEAIYELLESERSYTNDMTIVRKVFEKPLSKSGLITPDQLRSIFLNWRELIKGNQALLALLDKRKSESPNGVIDCIGDILYDNLPRMGAYIKFCSSQLSAGALLQELTDSSAAFRELCRHCQRDPRTQGLPLSTFLIKPMQRITKYPLLINKILQHTPANHPDKSHLEKALRRAEKLCAQVNEGVRENENAERLEWLQNHVTLDGLEEAIIFNSNTNCLGPRKLIYHGILAKAKTGRELVAFLFSDFLMLTQPFKSLNGQFVMEKSSSFDLKLYKKPLLLKDITVQKTNNSERTFTLATTIGEIAFICSTSGETSQWVKHLRVTIEKYENYESLPNVSRIPRSDDSLSAGRLLVEVVEAYNMKTNNCVCRVSLNNQVQYTPPSDSSFKWNATMQFLIQNIEKDVLIVELLLKYLFKPNDLLDQQEIRISEILHQTRSRGPVLRKLPLQRLAPAEILLKLDLVLFNLR